MTDKVIKWDDVLAIHRGVFGYVIGRETKSQYMNNPKPIYEAMGNRYQVIYDRLFDRRFDNSELLQMTGKLDFEPPVTGLERYLREFLEKPLPYRD